MKNKKRYKKAISKVFVYFAVSFFSLSFIPIFSGLEREYRTIPNFIIGGLFWIFLISGFVAVWRSEKILAPLARRLKNQGKKVSQNSIGILTFSSEPLHVVVYSISAVGLLLIALDLIFGFMPSALMFPVISITLYAIVVHAVIDGKNYKIVKLMENSLEDGHESNNE